MPRRQCNHLRASVVVLILALLLVPFRLAAAGPEDESASTGTSESRPVQVLVVYYSLTGNTERFAGIPGKMKTSIDDWNWKWKVDVTDKVGGAFATGAGQTGGKEFVVVSLLMFMINNRMVVAGPLYQDEEGEDIWAEAGAAAMTGPLDPGVSDKELDAAGRLGERLARLARKLKAR